MKYSTQPVNRRTALTLSSFAALTLTACSGRPTTSEPTPQPTTAPPSQTPTSSPSPSPIAPPTQPPTPSSTASTTAADSSTPPTRVDNGATPTSQAGEAGAPTNTQGRYLTRADLFNPSDSLKENLYNVATTSKKKGIGARLRDSDGIEAELRLENRFHKLTFNAGQDNNSASSDLTLRVEIYKDGKSDQFVDILFNEIKPIEVDVTNVNALKIDLAPFNQNGNKYNGHASLTGVMFDMRLE